MFLISDWRWNASRLQRRKISPFRLSPGCHGCRPHSADPPILKRITGDFKDRCFALLKGKRPGLSGLRSDHLTHVWDPTYDAQMKLLTMMLTDTDLSYAYVGSQQCEAYGV